MLVVFTSYAAQGIVRMGPVGIGRSSMSFHSLLPIAFSMARARYKYGKRRQLPRRPIGPADASPYPYAC